MSIPKIAFSFWEGPQFTYMHYLTLITFRKHNPDFKIIIYTSDNKVDCLTKWKTGEQAIVYSNLYDFNNIKKIPNLEVKYVNIEKDLNCQHILHSVWKSDIIRILKLYEHGGIYIDFDTLFIKPIPQSLLTIDKEIGFNKYNNTINNAFIIAKPKSSACKLIIDKIMQILDRRTSLKPIYMRFGPLLITSIFVNTPLENMIYYIPNDMTCPYIFNQMDKLFKSNEDLTTANTFCMHWYNGDSVSREYCSKFDINNINADNNIFERELIKALVD